MYIHVLYANMELVQGVTHTSLLSFSLIYSLTHSLSLSLSLSLSTRKRKGIFRFLLTFLSLFFFFLYKTAFTTTTTTTTTITGFFYYILLLSGVSPSPSSWAMARSLLLIVLLLLLLSSTSFLGFIGYPNVHCLPLSLDGDYILSPDYFPNDTYIDRSSFPPGFVFGALTMAVKVSKLQLSITHTSIHTFPSFVSPSDLSL